MRRSGALYGLLLGEYAGPEVPLAQGIREFFAGAAETLRETDYADACPIATVALEVSSNNEELRRACADVFNAWIEGGTERFAAEGLPRDRPARLVIQMLAALEGAFVLSPRPAQHRARRTRRRSLRQRNRSSPPGPTSPSSLAISMRRWSVGCRSGASRRTTRETLRAGQSRSGAPDSGQGRLSARCSAGTA